MRPGFLLIGLDVVVLGNFFWCRNGIMHVKSIDGFVLALPASMSDGEIEKQLTWHDATARKFFAMAGIPGTPLQVVATDGIAYTFSPGEKSDYVESILLSLYPRPMAHAIAYGLPVADTLPEDRDYLLMIASGIPVSEAASVRDGSIDRVYRKSYAEEMRKGEEQRQRQLASRQLLSSLSAQDRIAEARHDRGWLPCNVLSACGLVR